LVVAVADGAGSAARAADGAEAACAAFLAEATATLEGAELLAPLSEETARCWVRAARAAIAARAEAEGRAIRDYASTLLAAVLRHDESLFVQIGDGVIVAHGADQGGWAWVFWPDRGEYANETRFLSDENAVELAHVECSPHGTAELAVLTDGIERLVLNYAGRTVHEPFFDRNIQAVRRWRGAEESAALSSALAGYLGGPHISERTDDDVTLVLASRLSPGEPELAAFPGEAGEG
jgi:hypothetical protein